MRSLGRSVYQEHFGRSRSTRPRAPRGALLDVMKGMKHKRVRWSKEDGSGRGYEQQEMGLYRRVSGLGAAAKRTVPSICSIVKPGGARFSNRVLGRQERLSVQFPP